MWRLIPLAFLLPFFVLAPAAPAQPRWERMDYGPFLSSSVMMPGAHPEDPKGIVEKGITVRLGTRDHPGAVCFDTDLLCYAGGWTGGWLKLMGTPFDGTHRPPEGSRPAPTGALVFGVSGSTPGSPDPAGGEHDFRDPRPRPYGPLPAAWAKYKGLYVHGDRVVFSYSVAGRNVLETPEFDVVDGWPVFMRTFSVAPSQRPVTLNISDMKTPAGGVLVAVTSRDGVESSWRGGRHLVTVAPSAGATSFQVSITRRGAKAGDALRASGGRELADVVSLTKGGPARYPQTVSTRGALGRGDGAYVIDTLTLPDDNRWHAWMRPGGFDFFADGKRAAVSTWSGDVWVVDGIDDKLKKLTWKRFATGLFQPLGVKVVDEKVYVLGRDQITRLHDLNGDGEADLYENFNNDVEATPNFHEFAFDLHTDRDGRDARGTGVLRDGPRRAVTIGFGVGPAVPAGLCCGRLAAGTAGPTNAGGE